MRRRDIESARFPRWNDRLADLGCGCAGAAIKPARKRAAGRWHRRQPAPGSALGRVQRRLILGRCAWRRTLAEARGRGKDRSSDLRRRGDPEKQKFFIDSPTNLFYNLQNNALEKAKRIERKQSISGHSLSDSDKALESLKTAMSHPCQKLAWMNDWRRVCAASARRRLGVWPLEPFFSLRLTRTAPRRRRSPATAPVRARRSG